MEMNPENFVQAMNDPFECRRCGTCCIVWKIPITDDDVEREPAFSLFSKDGFMEKQANGGCVCYDVELGCKSYETRPQSCRDFTASPTKCMAAKISTAGIDVGETVEKWKKQEIDEATILARIYSQYVDMLTKILRTKTYVIGGKTMKDDLEKDFLLKTVKERTLEHSNVS